MTRSRIFSKPLTVWMVLRDRFAMAELCESMLRWFDVAVCLVLLITEGEQEVFIYRS